MTYEEHLNDFLSRHPYRRLAVGGGTFSYCLAGAPRAPALVFLNGGMNTSQIWMPYVDLLCDRFRVLLFDFPRDFPTNEALIRGMHSFFSALGIRKPILIGSSYGGMNAQLYTRAFPNEVEALILLSTGGMDRSSLGSLRRSHLLAPLQLAWLRRCNYEKLKPRLIEATLKASRQESPEDLARLREMLTAIFRDYPREKDVHISSILYDALCQEPVTPESFRALKGRILLILPREDYFSPAVQENLIRLMQDPEIRYLEGSHLGPVLRPQAYVELILPFLQKIMQQEETL